jgi:hypothetical protein
MIGLRRPRAVNRANLTDLETVLRLYRLHAGTLREAREEQREVLPQYQGKGLDDIEAELIYLVLRAARPAAVVEIGAGPGWSTSWILRALRDNGAGRLHSFDRTDDATRTVPEELSGHRWIFTPGDARLRMDRLPPKPGFLLVDAPGVGRWCVRRLLPWLAPGTPVAVRGSVRDRWEVRRWLAARGIASLTASRWADPDTHERLVDHKRKLRMSAPVRPGRANPTLFFET